MGEPTYTLREALDAIDTITDELDSLLVVAAIDVMDHYGINAPFWQEGGETQPDPLRRKFARALAERLVYSPDVRVCAVYEGDGDGGAETDPPSPPALTVERLTEAIEYAGETGQLRASDVARVALGWLNGEAGG